MLAIAGCLPIPDPILPGVPDPLTLAPTNVRIETRGETAYLEGEVATLSRYPGGAETLSFGASSDRHALELVVSHSSELAVDDVFPLGEWGERVTDSNGIVFGGLIGDSVVALTTGNDEDLDPMGTLAITALDIDAHTISLTFDGELFTGVENGAVTGTERIQGWLSTIHFTVDDLSAP